MKMKRVIQPSIVMLFIFIFGSLSAQTISKEEREKALALYDQAMKRTEEAVQGLSEEQLNFKPTPESWSIAECVEHLALSEDMFLQMLQKSLASPADPSKAPEQRLNDADVYDLITDRQQKVKTSEPLEPTHKWESTKATMKSLKDSRKETNKFIQKTDQDLRSYYYEMPFGSLDAYQMLLFGAGHQSRHNAQIQEIKNNPNFPTS